MAPEFFNPYFKDWKIEGVFNPGAIRRKDKKIELFVRIAETFSSKNLLEYPVAVPDNKFNYRIEKIPKNEFVEKQGNVITLKDHMHRLSNISHLRKVVLSPDGYHIEKIEQEPVFYPKEIYEEYGVEDPRIVKIKNEYIMSYVSVSEFGITSSFAKSPDLINWERLGIIFAIENKDCVLFPNKIRGEYVALTRPVGNFSFEKPSIWISYSKDLKYWGKETSIIHTRENSWDYDRIGAGCPPIKTKKGWLLIYHGVNNNVYSAGAILLDLNNPEKILARTPKNKPLFKPNSKFEKKGFVNNVVFPTGAILDLDKKHLLIYSGTADRYISIKRVLIKDIMNSLERV